ncbi:MAG: FAD-dependent oxidoreductase, partial [Pseudomonadota bacterium]
RAAIADFSDESNAEAFARFDRSTRALFQAFRGPMMEAPNPSIRSLISTVLRNPSLLGAMAPLATLDGHLARLFSDPRLVQLFGRYATYVGGSPLRSPALLGLIWQAEMEGVWHVVGGLAQLPKAVDALIRRHGVTCHYGHTVTQINCQDGAVTSVSADGLADVPADLVVFNGDPRALAKGALGPDVAITAPNTLRTPRSHSALVWSFAARPKGRALSHHNVFFSKDNAREFAELQAGQVPTNPTLYICAQDRGGSAAPPPGALERFEIIINAPAVPEARPCELEFDLCQSRTFHTLSRYGLTFDPMPQRDALMQPVDFAMRYPASLGALYGESPHGMTASLKRPRAKTAIPGLYLAGGGAHPGAGIPMAALSARHAVETILSDRTSHSRSLQTATHGGTSTA